MVNKDTKKLVLISLLQYTTFSTEGLLMAIPRREYAVAKSLCQYLLTGKAPAQDLAI
jgi:hypothetical protein